MVELSRGLSAAGLAAVAELEQRSVAADGGRLKLEWGVLNAGDGKDVQELLCWEQDRLVGFAGVYSFGSPNVEITGMVDPAERRRGLGGRLLDAAITLCRQRKATQALLVVPRRSTGGHALAASRHGKLEHSEHALLLTGEPAACPESSQLSLRAAGRADLDQVYRLLAAGFDWVPKDLESRLDAPGEWLMLVELAGKPVGTLRLTRDGDRGGIYGFVVDPALQGRGIGREVLRRACRQLRQDGASEVGLEVAVDNERALGLYTSIGFRQINTEDYYELPLEDDRPSPDQPAG